MKPVCVPCQRFFRMKKGGYFFTEGMPANGLRRPLPGRLAPKEWQPYKVWSGDLWECPECKAQIISGTGFHPVIEKHFDGFETKRKELRADQLQVNDC